jgi:hypothetical protein
MNAPIAEFSDYEGLRKALNACREKRDISFERMDEITGAPPGYFAKLLGPRAIRRIGLQSLGWAFGGLGVKCVIVSDPEALAKVESRYAKRDNAHLQSVRGGVLNVSIKRAFLRKIGAKGGVNRWKNVSPKKRSRLARRAVKIRNSKLNAQRRQELTRAATKARWRGKAKQIEACISYGGGASQGHAFQEGMGASTFGLREPLSTMSIPEECREGSHRSGLSRGQRRDRESTAALPALQFVEGAIIDRSPARELEGTYGKNRAQSDPSVLDSEKKGRQLSKRKLKEQKRRARQRKAAHKARKAAT